MIVRFDSLNRFELPKLYLCSPGSKYLDGVVSGVAGILTDTQDEELIINFNAVSELNFRLNRTKRDNAEDTEFVYKLFRTTQNRRMIYVDDIGFFIITDVTDGFDGLNQYKDVRAESCEIEIQSKNIPFIDDGTYQFGDLLNTVISTVPGWTIGEIDEGVADRWRTFEDVSADLNCLGFMMENMQDAYECIFTFDCINRIVNVYDQNNYVEETSIHITKDDLINSIDITENSDDLYTVLSVTGDEDLNIAAVNPLGTGQIYNFDYYISWMSDALQAKLNAWKVDVDAAEEPYIEKNREYYELLDEQSNYQSELQKIDTQLTMYRRCRDNIVAESSKDEIDEFNVVIVSVGGTPISTSEDIATIIESITSLIVDAEDKRNQVVSELDTITLRISGVQEEINEIRNSVEITSYFTDGQDTSLLDELTNYMFEGNYTDEYIGVTSIMSYEEKFEQMETLYRRAVAQLERISQPRQEFSIDVENFLFAKEFEAFSQQLRVGSLINVELDLNDIAQLFLTCITVNYDDGTLSLTFGNRFDKFDPKSLFDNVLGSVQKSANTLNYIKEVLYPIKNGEINKMQEYVETSRTLTKDMALTATDQEIVIDDTGFTGRKLNPNGHYDDRQIKIAHNTVALTNDAWGTCGVAIGEIVLPEALGGGTEYGINARLVLGEMIMGSGLEIIGPDGETPLLSVVDNKINTSVGDLDGRVSTLEQTADGLSIVVSKLDENGNYTGDIDHVTTTTGYTFNADGLTIARENQEMENLLTNTGMYVNRKNGQDTENILTADNTGVNALNVTSRQYLIVGDHARFENYGNNRTACFYLSDDSN